MLASYHNSGFQISFPNNITVSVQFGSGNYCNNYNSNPDWIETPMLNKCENAEVAVLKTHNGDWLTGQCWQEVFNEKIYDDVVGYVTAEQIAKVITWASTQPC